MRDRDRERERESQGCERGIEVRKRKEESRCQSETEDEGKTAKTGNSEKLKIQLFSRYYFVLIVDDNVLLVSGENVLLIAAEETSYNIHAFPSVGNAFAALRCLLSFRGHVHGS